jgi:hypothetical protein
LRPRSRLTRPPASEPPAQRHPVRMRLTRGLVPVDLPVDGIVVLEHEERAGEAQCTECALREGGCSR